MASSSGGSTLDAADHSQPNYHQEITVDVGTSSHNSCLLSQLIIVQSASDPTDDADSTLGSENASLRSTSVTSSIYDYKYDNGRRYHAYREGRYPLPNDEAEQDRLDLSHHMFRLILGGALFRAPIRKHHHVLDIGTGTGIWAIDFADEFPSALVIGTDLSPIQPSIVPPNCRFYVDDVESEWTFDEKFDFIHGRAIGGSIANFELLYRRIYDNLNPGGWVEIQEYESSFYSDDDPQLLLAPNCKKLTELCNIASEKSGRSFAIASQQRQKMIDAGFEDVQNDLYKVCLRSASLSMLW
jgi:SAM-dependent methyltransferase